MEKQTNAGVTNFFKNNLGNREEMHKLYVQKNPKTQLQTISKIQKNHIYKIIYT